MVDESISEGRWGERGQGIKTPFGVGTQARLRGSAGAPAAAVCCLSSWWQGRALLRSGRYAKDCVEHL